MESRRGVAPRECRFAGGRVHWLPRGIQWSGVWVLPPLRRVHSPECTYYTNTWNAGASGRSHTDVVGITGAVPGLSRPRRRNGALARTRTSSFLLRTEACRSLTPREQLVARDGVAPSHPVLQTGALLRELSSRKLVLPHGNAPWSVDYRSTALLLSYRRGPHPGVVLWEPEVRVRRCGALTRSTSPAPFGDTGHGDEEQRPSDVAWPPARGRRNERCAIGGTEHG